MKKKILSLFFILVVLFSCFNNFFASDDISGDIILNEIHRKSNVIFFESNFDYPEYSFTGLTMDNSSCKVGTKANLDINIDLEGKYYYYSSNMENLYVFNEPVNIFFSSDSTWYYTLIDKLDVTYDVYKVKYTGVSSNKFYIDETCLTESGKLSTKYNTTSSYIERVSTSADFYYYVICNKFINVDVYSDKNKTLKLNKVIDDTIQDNNSKLKITYEYNEAKTECKINATLVDGAFTDKIYYSNLMPGLTGLTVGKVIFPHDGITVNQNQDLFFQAEDKDGNIIATNAVFINGINVLNPEDFVVDFEFKGSKVFIFPRIIGKYGASNVHYSILLDINNISDIRLYDYNQWLIYSSTYDIPLNNGSNIIINPGSSFILENTSSFDKKDLSLLFKVRNVSTQEIVVSKSYNITVRSNLDIAGDEGVTGGTINPGQDNEEEMTPENDKNIKPGTGDNPFIGINENSSIQDILNSVKDSFSTFGTLFSILPGFIWAFIGTILIVLIVLRVLGR